MLWVWSAVLAVVLAYLQWGGTPVSRFHQVDIISVKLQSKAQYTSISSFYRLIRRAKDRSQWWSKHIEPVRGMKRRSYHVRQWRLRTMKINRDEPWRSNSWSPWWSSTVWIRCKKRWDYHDIAGVVLLLRTMKRSRSMTKLCARGSIVANREQQSIVNKSITLQHITWCIYCATMSKDQLK